ncbi:MFS transporter [candidate division KSB1 bacterium]|nr:MFS transporter [candidate division KSB1 bacterium]
MANDIQKISIKEKIGYGFGDTASNLFFQTFMLFLLYFYTDIFGIPAAVAGTMFLLTRIWDTINDPLMGAIADRTNTKWGKFRPYLVWTVIPFGIIGVLTFTTPNLSMTGKIVYAYVTYTLMMMAYTAVNIPYSALMGVISPNSLERTSLSSYRFILAFVGALIVQGLTIPLVENLGKDNESIVQAELSNSTIIINEKGAGNAKLILVADDGKGETTRSDFLVKVNKQGLIPPVVINSISDTTLGKGFGSYEIDLSYVFKDAESDPLTYSAESENSEVVTAEISDSKLKLNETGIGATKITVSADDGKGDAAKETFVLAVSMADNNPPTVQTPFDGIVENKNFSSQKLVISNNFQDEDGDDLAYSVNSSNEAVVTATVVDSTITLEEKGTGSATVTVSADDNKGGLASTTFSVFVKGEGNNLPVISTLIENINLSEGFQTHEIDVSNVFSDMDGDEISLSLINVNEAKGFQYTMAVFAVLAVILFLITFVTTTERVLPPAGQKSSLKNDLKDLAHNRPWIVLFFLGIFALSYTAIKNGAIIYYFKYYVGNTALASVFMVSGTAAFILGITLTKYFSKKFGKRNFYIALWAIASVLTVFFYFAKQEDIVFMFVLQIISSLVMGPTAPLIWAMYADTADYSEWKTGRRATGLVFSAATFAQKFGWTIGGALAGWILAYFGFKANVEQTVEAQNGIRLMMSFIPAVAGVLTAIAAIFYPIDDSLMKKIEVELNERKA